MATQIPMIQPHTGATRMGFQGVSWTTLLFGPFPALFRGHVIGAVVVLAAAVFTFGASTLVFMFVYNKWHMSWLEGRGFVSAYRAQHNSAPQNVVNVHVGDSVRQENAGGGMIGDVAPQPQALPQDVTPQLQSAPRQIPDGR